MLCALFGSRAFFFPSEKEENMTNRKYNERMRLLTLTAMFCAIAYVVMFVLKISGIGGFLTFDVKDAIIAAAAMLLGPAAGAVISFIVALLEMVTVSTTGIWGAIMNFVSSAAFTVTASAVYNYAPKIKKTVTGAWCGLGVSIIGTTVVMLGMNLIITPIYTHMPTGAVAGMIAPLLLPFNLIKCVLNAALVMIIYKPISLTLRKSGFFAASGGAEKKETYFSKLTLLVFLISAAVAAVCVVLLIRVFGGHFNVFG